MKLIDELFKKYDLVESSLIPYGFDYQDGIYSYKRLIHNNQFELLVTVNNKKMEGILIDKDFNEEYYGINIENAGGFVSVLKEECKSILLDIRNHCFNKRLFIYPQSNRISKLIEDKYQVKPEYLWDTDPGFGVFRNKHSNKWFGIIMNIKKNKITGNEEVEIEVLNVMLKDKTSDYLEANGIYKAYHMNKRNWVSIILDDTLDDKTIMELIDISHIYSEVHKKGKIYGIYFF